MAFNTYLKAGFKQALDSFQVIREKILIVLDQDFLKTKLSESFESLSIELDESDFPLVKDPTNHPAISFIKKTLSKIFSSLGLDEALQNSFIKDFNEHIESTIVDIFGKEQYEIHITNTKEKWLRENEKDFLLYIKDLAKLGFVKGEHLQYQESFGTWHDIRKYGLVEEQFIKNKTRHRKFSSIEYNVEEINEVDEIDLKPIDVLIEEYFDSYQNDSEGYLHNILFLIADFGKGKTSFLHQYASRLAQQYLKTHEGPFPVYLNLNQYDNYSNSPSLGVIANYLAKGFKIDIKDEYFKKKKYFFLVDSLDECGELSEVNIDKVVKDIHAIQNLDNINQRTNRIIVASRPIAKGLEEQIRKYKPYCISEKEVKDRASEITDNYISIYGFKKEQFDNYVEFAIKNFLEKEKNVEINATEIFREIINSITKNEKINLYDVLHNTVLKKSELKRPIFAYMIYKLLISNSNFIDLGKVGVYISFLNQLSRDAKHKDDLNHKISLKDEFVYRNILHASALLWQYKRQSGEQTSLTKADICRTIEEEEIDKDDRKVLAEFKEIESIHFLSHSYLGEKENTLHFQHQSFAEILLAEYYLKIIIKYAIEENTGVEEARVRLSIGVPTDQTIEFLKGLLQILKECALGNPSERSVYSKRELLIPLLSSMAINKHNKKLYSTRLSATWFEKYEEEIFFKNKITESIINDFPITQKVLNKIEQLASSIISSTKTYFLDEPSVHSILFKNELTSISNFDSKFHEIDKWFALIAGNIMGTDVEKKIFFNSNLRPKDLFSLIRNWNFHSGIIPFWAKDLFIGIDMTNQNELLIYENMSLSQINFSHSYLRI